MSLPVFEQLGATLGISFEGFLILKVRIDWHTTPVLDEILQRDLLQLFLQLLDALGLLEAELHRQDLHGADVEEAPLHVKAHKQVEHLVADVAVQVADVELHGPLLGSDHRVGVITHAVLLSLTRLHHDGDAKELLTWKLKLCFRHICTVISCYYKVYSVFLK